jgi:hypothetical protein
MVKTKDLGETRRTACFLHSPRTLHPRSTNETVKNVLVADIAKLMDAATEINARQNLALNVSSSSKQYWIVNSKQCKPAGYNPILKNKFLVRLLMCAGKQVQPLERNACAKPNAVTNDGMHICMSTFGARINANFGSLSGCTDAETQKASCANEFNKVFMSMRPIVDQAYRIHGN